MRPYLAFNNAHDNRPEMQVISSIRCETWEACFVRVSAAGSSGEGAGGGTSPAILDGRGAGEGTAPLAVKQTGASCGGSRS
jgi:hypothetical protein